VLGTPIRTEEFLTGKALALFVPSVVASYGIYGIAIAVIETFSPLLAANRWAISQSRRAASAAATCPASNSSASTRAVMASRASDIARFWETSTAAAFR